MYFFTYWAQNILKTIEGDFVKYMKWIIHIILTLYDSGGQTSIRWGWLFKKSIPAGDNIF